MEADLLRVYGVDLLDLGTTRLKWDRLARLIQHLPPDAATVAAISGPAAQWGSTEYLLALVVDALHVANWQRVGDKKAKAPTPLPRPGDPERRALRRTKLSQPEIHRRLRAQLARRQREHELSPIGDTSAEAVTDGA